MVDLIFEQPLQVALQGYLAYKKPPPRRTLQYGHAWVLVAVLGGEGVLVSEVPLYFFFFTLVQVLEGP